MKSGVAGSKQIGSKQILVPEAYSLKDNNIVSQYWVRASVGLRHFESKGSRLVFDLQACLHLFGSAMQTAHVWKLRE